MGYSLFDAAVWFGTGLPDEGDAGLDQPPVRGVEVGDAEDEVTSLRTGAVMSLAVPLLDVAR